MKGQTFGWIIIITLYTMKASEKVDVRCLSSRPKLTQVRCQIK